MGLSGGPTAWAEQGDMTRPMDEAFAELVEDLTNADSLTATIEQIVKLAQTTIGAADLTV